MADIFLSYSRSDLARARQFEQALEACGWSVFWDRELLPGEGFRHAIENELRQARCVIVLWSKTSIESEWVIDEAESGKQNGRLVSVRIDDIEMPLGLRQLQAANLMDWRGDGEHPEFQLLTRRLRALIPSGADLPTESRENEPRENEPRENEPRIPESPSESFLARLAVRYPSAEPTVRSAFRTAAHARTSALRVSFSTMR